MTRRHGMTGAPERIWARHFISTEQDEVVKGGWDDKEDRGLHEYIRADTHDALVKAADELARSLKDCMETLTSPDDVICCSGIGCGCIGATIHQQSVHYANEALTAYSKAMGENK